MPDTPLLDQPAKQLPQICTLTMYDLPSEDPEDSGLPDEYHDLQPQLLSRTLRILGYLANQIFNASDLNLYYDPQHPKWFKRPDWFLVLGVPRLYKGQDSRSSYVHWDEKVTPTLIVEFLSPGTEVEDLGPFHPSHPSTDPATPEPKAPPQTSTQPPGKFAPPSKFEVYEQILKILNYIVYDRRTQTLHYFRLTDGQYQPQPVSTQNPRIWIPELDLGLGLWDGTFEGLPQIWLRWCDAQGNWCPTDTEAERQAKEAALWREMQERTAKEEAQWREQQAQLAQQALTAELEAERQKRARIADRLRALGIDPDSLD